MRQGGCLAGWQEDSGWMSPPWRYHRSAIFLRGRDCLPPACPNGRYAPHRSPQQGQFGTRRVGDLALDASPQKLALDSAVAPATGFPARQTSALQTGGLAPEHTSSMSTDSHRERIAATIRISSRPLDDDQVAARTGISPRQTVNQICRSLERAGMVRRRPGPDGKVVNEWLGDRDQGPGSIPGPASAAVSGKGAPADPSATADGAVPAGDSAEQRGAERVMLDLLGAQLGLQLNPDNITVPSGERVQVDGADASRTVLAECWAHQGPPKSAQKHKVLADAFKLAWIATTIYPSHS